MVDTAGDDDLVKGRRLFPSIITVGGLALDRLELLIAVLDQLIVDRPRAISERLDDLDGVNLVSHMREIGGLVTGASADFEHPLSHLGINVRSHPAHDMRA